MSPLQRNSLLNLRLTLDDLSSRERLIAYKRAVPFVHVPIELLEQWAGHRRQLDLSWFRELFAEEQTRALSAFDDIVERYRSSLAPGIAMPDVPEVLDLASWTEVMAAAATLRSEFATLFASVVD
jgi:hypothetical protein